MYPILSKGWDPVLSVGSPLDKDFDMDIPTFHTAEERSTQTDMTGNDIDGMIKTIEHLVNTKGEAEAFTLCQ